MTQKTRTGQEWQLRFNHVTGVLDPVSIQDLINDLKFTENAARDLHTRSTFLEEREKQRSEAFLYLMARSEALARAAKPVIATHDSYEIEMLQEAYDAYEAAGNPTGKEGGVK